MCRNDRVLNRQEETPPCPARTSPISKRDCTWIFVVDTPDRPPPPRPVSASAPGLGSMPIRGCRHRRSNHVAGAAPIRWTGSGRPRSCRCSRRHPDCGRSRCSRRSAVAIPAFPPAARSSVACDRGKPCTAPTRTSSSARSIRRGSRACPISRTRVRSVSPSPAPRPRCGIGSIISAWPSRAGSMPRWCSAVRASWRSPTGCRTRSGASAACRPSTAATVSRRRSAISRLRRRRT
jgi:hypothetical protein